jgi:competence protein ComEA
MKEICRRFVLVGILIAMPVVSSIKGCVSTHNRETAAFSFSGRPDSGRAMIRVIKSHDNSGVYDVPAGSDVASVINLTVGGFGASTEISRGERRQARTGDVIAIQSVDPGKPRFSINVMGVTEKILLGIPLDPNSMSAADWELLPGIGPKTAGMIVCDRQINGDYRSWKDVGRVPGIGEKRLEELARFF